MHLRLVVAAVVAVLLAGTHWKAYVTGKNAVQAQWTEQKLLDEKARAAMAADATATERKLQATIDTERKGRRDEANRIAHDYGVVIDSLLNRAERTTNGANPATAGDGKVAPGCTGAELYRQDGEFLAREAARADTLRLELARCYRAWDKAREELIDFSARNRAAGAN